MKTVHIFDIDSTIANNSHRAKLLDKTCVICLSKKPDAFRAMCPTCGIETDTHIDQKAWDLFFDTELVYKDTPEPKALEYANKLRERNAVIHFLTGRDEDLREVTTLWLKAKFNKKDNETLIMRPESEKDLEAEDYKERAFSRLKTEMGYGDDVTFFFYDDDSHVYEMYSKYGIVVQCPMAFDFLMPSTKKVL